MTAPSVITQYLSEIPQLAPWSQWQLTPIKGGLNNHVWLLQSTQQKLIFRVSTNTKTDQQSIKIQKQLATRKLTAEIYHLGNIDNHIIMVMEYIEGEQQKAKLWDNEQRQLFAKQLAQLHSCKLTTDIEKLNIPEHLHGYLQKLERLTLTQSQKQHYQTQIAMLTDQLAKACQTSPQTQQQVLCHNDLNQLNIIYQQSQQRFVLLDWDEARIGDLFFDLAGFTIEHQLNQQQTHQWLGQYFNELNQTQNQPTSLQDIITKLSTYQQAYRLICELWHLLHQPPPTLSY